MKKMNQDFASKDLWRVFRIMSEFVDGFEELSRINSAVAIFGSARINNKNKYYKLAQETAYLFAKSGYAIITGAGSGIMEAANKGASQAGGKSIGLNILIPKKQVPNKYITKLIEFRYFFCRKVMFAKYSKAFLVFPGGYGTLDELFEALALVQTARVDTFPIILFCEEFWKPLTNWLTNKLLNKTISKKDLLLFKVVNSPQEALAVVKKFYK
jgi:hypothetical protein